MYVPNSGMASLYSSSTFSFFRSRHPDFHDGCTSVLLSLATNKGSLFIFLLKYHSYLANIDTDVVLICISLMVKDV